MVSITMSIAQWVQHAQHGTDEEKRLAFDALVEHYRPMAFSTAYRLLNDPMMAEDATQDAFITAYQRINQLQNPSAFGGWLKRIVFTQCDRLVRGKKPTLEPLDNRFDLATDLPSPEDYITSAEFTEQLHAVVNALPEHERIVTQRFYLKGESQKEIATRLSIPVTTVKKRLQYAREHLRAIINELNATLDSVFDDMVQQPQPQRQPIYIYNHQRYEIPEDDEY